MRRLTVLLRLYDLDAEHVSDLVELESLAVERPQGDLATIVANGLAHWREGNVPQALAHVFAVREHVGTDPAQRWTRQRATLNFAAFARNLGKIRFAKKLVDELLCEPPEPALLVDTLILAASVWGRAGSSEAGLAFIARAAVHVGADEHDKRAMVRHQEARLLKATGQHEEAAVALEAALEAYGLGDDTMNHASALVLRTELQVALGRFDEAIARGREAVAFALRHNHGLVAVNARMALGQALIAAGRRDEAEEVLLTAEAAADLLGDRHLVEEAREMRRPTRG